MALTAKAVVIMVVVLVLVLVMTRLGKICAGATKTFPKKATADQRQKRASPMRAGY
jgi:hypothetical protein